MNEPVKNTTLTFNIAVLAVIAGSSFLPSNGVGVYGVKKDAERAGVTNMIYPMQTYKKPPKEAPSIRIITRMLAQR